MTTIELNSFISIPPIPQSSVTGAVPKTLRPSPRDYSTHGLKSIFVGLSGPFNSFMSVVVFWAAFLT